MLKFVRTAIFGAKLSVQNYGLSTSQSITNNTLFTLPTLKEKTRVALFPALFEALTSGSSL
jgi:hypothetical protein